jgi:hypothetical protein
MKAILHNIDLSCLRPLGKVACEFVDNLLYMTTNRAIPSQRFDLEHIPINSYLLLPERYRLPLRIDLTVKIDGPGLYLLFGQGHVNIGTFWSDNRRLDDIISPERKTKNYHNYIKLNEFTDISLLYDFKEMQIIIDGEERYYSKKERYMKSPDLEEKNKDGFELKIACDKFVNMYIKLLSITEYADTCKIIHSDIPIPTAITRNMGVAVGEKPTFEKCIAFLSTNIQSEIIKMDEYLKSRKELKFKRQIEKNGNKITYVASEYGFSYSIYLSNDMFDHSLQWYLITNGTPETWHRKADRMEETLKRLDATSETFAQQMFFSLDDCVGCYSNCLARTKYSFRDENKIVCHGKLKFRMNQEGFSDVRVFIDEVRNLIMES